MMRVLYAEDDPQVAEMVRMSFERLADRYSLEIVGDGGSCLAATERAEYDVILLDLMMPDVDGLHVLGQLVARRIATPVIMVSGHGQHDLAVRALRAGAVDCIDKNSPDFRRIPEIALRVHSRQSRRTTLPREHGTAPHTVLFLDPDPAERDSFAIFLASSSPHLRLVAESEAALEPLLRGATHYDAVILGANLTPHAMLAALRQLRAYDDTLPVIVLGTVNDAETTIAAFKLGARDYLLRGSDSFAELVFSLNNALKQADADRLNTRLSLELAELNRSLAAQVAARTRELESEIIVRREAEKRSEENAARLQALSNRILRVQEDERHSIAHELHDQIGQLLTGLRFQVEKARQAAPSAAVENALSITDELLRSVRTMTLQLRPRLLDDLGLRPALEWHAKNFKGQTGIDVDLEISLPEHRLNADLEIAAFRMVQEALTNVARHSGASTAAVTVAADDHSLHIEVSDRGCGFDPARALAKHDSLGLTGLSERVRLAGGRFEIYSQRGQGTRLHAEFALTPPPAHP